ncbi:MAG TPA: hypothetical protein VGG77_08610 [Roseiarcus sp.]|jgi:hypothetical protein
MLEDAVLAPLTGATSCFLFLDSGSTLIAAEKTGSLCRAGVFDWVQGEWWRGGPQLP